MRRVACYAAVSHIAADESRETVLQSFEEAIGGWLSRKGLQSADTPQVDFALADGRTAQYRSDQWDVPDGQAIEHQLTEPTEDGQFLTRLLVGGRGQELAVFVELRAGGAPATLRPVTIDPRCPEIYRTILGMREWYLGGSPVSVGPVPFTGEEGAAKFLEALHHRDRNLPLLAVSKIDGAEFSPGFAKNVGRDLAGLAIVATLDEQASWGITNQVGREWSCYNGAVRTYWPFKGKSANAFHHPLWRTDSLAEQAGSLREASARLREQLRRQLLALSAYTISEPALLLEIVARSREARLDQQRRNAEAQGDWRNLAELYCTENIDLKAQRQELEDRTRDLEDKVGNLMLALRHQPVADGQQPIPPEDTPSLEAVSDAVREAQERFTETLVFGEDVQEGVRGLDEIAGPPDKVFDYLKTLSDMTRQRNGAGLGKDMIPWLSERAVKASGETETTVNNAAEMKRRTWRDGSGARRKFINHLKPNDGASPDRCVRIYFEYDERSRKTIVGWVGRHP